MGCGGWGVGGAHKVWALNCAVGRLELGGRSQREAPVSLSESTCSVDYIGSFRTLKQDMNGHSIYNINCSRFCLRVLSTFRAHFIVCAS